MSILSRTAHRPRNDEVSQLTPPVSLIDIAHPDIMVNLDRNHQAAGYILKHHGVADDEITKLRLVANGWSAKTNSLAPLGQSLADLDPTSASVIIGHARLNLPTDPRQLGAYLKDNAYGQVGARRSQAIRLVGAAAGRRFGLDTVTIDGHSLGGLDGTRATIEADQFAVEQLDLLATAGLLQDHEWIGVVRRISRSHCPNSSGREIKPRNAMQVGIEAVYALRERSGLALANIRDYGTLVTATAFKDDLMFPVREGVIPEGFNETNYTLMTEGDTCHSKPTHASEAMSVARVLINY